MAATMQDRDTHEPPRGPQAALDTARLSRLYRWGLLIARRRRAVVGAWGLVLVLCAASYPFLQSSLGAPGHLVKGSESERVEQLLDHRFTGIGSETDGLALYSAHHTAGDPAYRAAIVAIVKAVRKQKGIRGVVGPYDANAVGQIGDEEHVVLVIVALKGDVNQRFNASRPIQEAATRAARGSGVEAWLTGASPISRDLADTQRTDTARSEAVGLPVALAITLLAFGALVAAMLPLALAMAGLLLSYGLLAGCALFFHFDALLVSTMTMIGLGIGIDYSLFIVSRFREELARTEEGSAEAREGDAREGDAREGDAREGDAREGDALERDGRQRDGREPKGQEQDERERVADAIGLALATSGRTIIFSGVIVALSLAAMFVVDFPVFREVAAGTVLVVFGMLAAATTLLPATLALLGSRVNRGALPERLRPANARPGAEAAPNAGWARWALLVMRHPIAAGLPVAVILIVAAMPAFSLHYGIDLGVLRIPDTASAKGGKLLSRAFSPGAVSPMQIVVVAPPGPGAQAAEARAARSLSGKLEGDPHISGLKEFRDRAGVLLTVVPESQVDSLASAALVTHIRRDLAPPIEAHGGPAVLVGGGSAQTLDVAAELRSKLALIMALILLPSLLFLTIVFRSIVLPIKAVLMNLLATGAAIGVVVYIFQDGHGEHLLNFRSTGFIQAFLPLVVFALLFGLSMDYEVFLIRRMQEEWRRSHDNQRAVASGIANTARPITAAAAIMVAVFGCFTTAHLLELKQMGFALALAVALDATLVRLVLVPAAMRLLGARNWWLPAWLERRLPDLGVD